MINIDLIRAYAPEIVFPEGPIDVDKDGLLMWDTRYGATPENISDFINQSLPIGLSV